MEFTDDKQTPDSGNTILLLDPNLKYVFKGHLRYSVYLLRGVLDNNNIIYFRYQ